MIDPVEELRKRMNRGASASANASAGAASYDAGGADEDPVAAMRNRFAAGQQQSAPAEQPAPEEQPAQPVQPAVRRPAPSPLRPGRAANVEDGQGGAPILPAEVQNDGKVNIPEATGPARGRGLRQIEEYQQQQETRRKMDEAGYSGMSQDEITEFLTWRRENTDHKGNKSYGHYETKGIPGVITWTSWKPEINKQANLVGTLLEKGSRGEYDPASPESLYNWRRARLQETQERSEGYLSERADRINALEREIADLEASTANNPAERQMWQQQITERQLEIQRLQQERDQAYQEIDEAQRQEREAFARLPKDQQEQMGRNWLQSAWASVQSGTENAVAHFGKTGYQALDALFGRNGVLDELTGNLLYGLFDGGVEIVRDLTGSTETKMLDPFGDLAARANVSAEQLNEQASARTRYDKRAQVGQKIVNNVEIMAPYAIMMALSGGTAAAVPELASTQGLQYLSAVGTASSPAQLAGLYMKQTASSLLANPAAQYTFVTQFADSAATAREEGAGGLETLLYATFNAAANTMLEMSGGHEGNIGKGWAALNPRNLVRTMLEETSEEELQGIYERALKAIYKPVELFSNTNPDAILNPNTAYETAIDTILATPFISLEMAGVQQGFGAVAGRVEQRDQQHRDEIVHRMDEAVGKDLTSANPESQAELIAVIEDIAKSPTLSRVFTQMYHTTPAVARQELRALASEEQAEREAAQGEKTPSVAEATDPRPSLREPAAESTAPAPATGEEMLLNPVRPQEAAGAPLAQGGTETAAQGAETPTAQAPVLNSNEGTQGAETAQTEERARTTATQATRGLANKYGGLRFNDTRGKIISLSNMAKTTDFSDPEQVRQLWSQARSDAEDIFRTAEDPSSRTGGDTGNDIRSYLRSQRIKIDGRLRSDVPSRFDNFQDMRNKTMGTLTFSNTEGRSLDSVYAEMQDMFGKGMFPEDVYSHADMLDAILEAVENERGTRYTYEQSTPESERGRAVAEITMGLMRAAESVTGQTIPTPVQEARQSMTAEQAREAAIQSELDADFEGDLSREDAERIVDERFEQYGEYDLDKILNSFEEETYDDEHGGEDAFDEYAYYAEQFHGADRAETGDGAAAETAADEGRSPGGETQLPAPVGPRALAGGSAENDGAGAGRVREPGSAALVSRETGLAPAGQTAAETRGGGTPSVAAESRSDSSLTEGASGENGPKEGQKRSKTESHTEQNIAGKLGGEQDAVYYTPKSERESLTNAINRVNSDFNGEVQRLSDKAMWTGEDIDTALTIYGFLQMDGVRTGDFSAAQAWGRLVSARGTESGRALQAFAKWTRTGAAAAAKAIDILSKAENLSEEDKARIAKDITAFSHEFDSIKDGDLGSIRDLIKRQAKYRNTLTFVKKNFDWLLNQIDDFDWLKTFAARQLLNIPADYTVKPDIGQQMKTIQALNQLSRLTTFVRNLGGNLAFGIQDTIAQDAFGVALDSLVSKATGKRTVALDKGWITSRARRAALTNLEKSILEVAGDVDMGDNADKYGRGANRTYKMSSDSLVARTLSRWEQLQGYSLQSSDAFFRGQIEGAQREGLEKFGNLTEAEIDKLAQSMADYRLFQNKDGAYKLFKDLHDLANGVLGVGGEKRGALRSGGFGLGDALMAYPGVPANIGMKLLEYSPANILKGGRDMIKLLLDVKKGKSIDVTRQQKAVMDISRGLTGLPLVTLFTALASAGLFRNADDEDDPNAQALARAEGRQGVQINLSAAWRWLNGESADWKDGDNLMKIDWLEPLNGFLALGSLLASQEEQGADWLSRGKSYVDATLQSMADLPGMSSIANLIDSYKYSKADSTFGKVLDAGAGLAADTLTGSFLPPLLGQVARSSDPYQRDTAGENTLDTARRRLFNAIPGLRQTLPEKLDNFGNPVEQADSDLFRWLNNFVLPGAISDYKAPEMYEALDEFAQRTGDKDVYPERKAPTSFGKDEDKVDMTPEERQLYQETYGKTCEDYYSSVLLGDEYKDLSDGEKQWLLGQIQDYAKHRAQQAVLRSRGESREDKTWDKVDDVAKAGVDPAAYLLGKKQADTDGSGGTPSNQEVYNWLLGSDYSERQQRAIWDATKGSNVHSWEEYRDTNPVTYLMNAGMTQKGAQRMYAQINTDGRSDLTQRELYQYYLAHPEAEELIREYWDNQRGFSDSWDKSKRKPKKDWTD